MSEDAAPEYDQYQDGYYGNQQYNQNMYQSYPEYHPEYHFQGTTYYNPGSNGANPNPYNPQMEYYPNQGPMYYPPPGQGRGMRYENYYPQNHQLKQNYYRGRGRYRGQRSVPRDQEVPSNEGYEPYASASDEYLYAQSSASNESVNDWKNDKIHKKDKSPNKSYFRDQHNRRVERNNRAQREPQSARNNSDKTTKDPKDGSAKSSSENSGSNKPLPNVKDTHRRQKPSKERTDESNSHTSSNKQGLLKLPKDSKAFSKSDAESGFSSSHGKSSSKSHPGSSKAKSHETSRLRDGSKKHESEESKKREKKTAEKDRLKGIRKGRHLFRGLGPEDEETQRGTLIEQLSSNGYECMVCCDIVRREVAIWSCTSCYHVFHLRCIKKWARTLNSSAEDGSGWRCPACQNLTAKVPNQYRCFCAKVRDPEWSRFETPHSCGEVCSKDRGNGCPHPCNILCHPGPCPPCQAMVTKKCDCGKTKHSVRCGQSKVLKCDKTCGKLLNCGQHNCSQVCHQGSCQPCDVTLIQPCYCSKTEREVLCGSKESFAKSFTCKSTCARSLDCGNHSCEEICHSGDCPSCPLLPTSVTHCPCGKTPLDELTGGQKRTQCTDPITPCQQLCEKQLKCGPEAKPHKCKLRCHVGPCGVCEGESPVMCRCEAVIKEFDCVDLVQFTEAEPFTCDRRCNKKKPCGRHKCSNLCCVDTEHKCELICGRKLNCGLHKCEETCHKGNCPPCWQASFDELTCYCGVEVLYPPIPCGTEPPECQQTCTRLHDCEHPVLHNCHSDEKCPPCTSLTKRRCMGGHEVRNNIPCHLKDISCGLPCNKPLSCGRHKCIQTCHKPLSCGRHKCIQTCHKGFCEDEEFECAQACTLKRKECGHPCNQRCHGEDTCPQSICKAPVTLICRCGHRTEKAICGLGASELDETNDFQRISTSNLADKLQDLQSGQSVDISNLVTNSTRVGHIKKPMQLECNENCAKIERNKRIALALEIKNPDLEGKLGNPLYPQPLKDFVRKNPVTAANVEKALSELVKTAKQAKQPRKSHIFPIMNWESRKFIHELAEWYGCETQSYDQEPKKNVIATAHRDRCFLPNISLTQSVQRDVSGPKPPVPIPHTSKPEVLRTQVKLSKQTPEVVNLPRPKTPPSWTSRNAYEELEDEETPSSWMDRLDEPKPSSDSRAAKSASGNRPSWAKNRSSPEPVIDYFDMTD
ncbi:unnamed protein product [Owenia fusiformis]|uniref:Shuttle craft n=1 Tax=Owenia fusiformis TaxID=6347 RepID=A0A8S4P9X2_OWEFU|nr:unnamed protein product [Owenia fusiformis]